MADTQKDEKAKYERLSQELNDATRRVLDLEKELRSARVEERRLRASLSRSVIAER